MFERALDVDPRSVDLWVSHAKKTSGEYQLTFQVKYTDMELKARNINHARNLFDRGITTLPRIDAVSFSN